MRGREESLWLDDAGRGLKLINNDKIQNKLFKLIKHFDSKPSKTIKTPTKTPKISSPISFSHVSHMDGDGDSNFGLHHSFGVDSIFVRSMVPATAIATTTTTQQIAPRRISSSVSNSNITVLTQSTAPTSIDEDFEPYTSVLDPAAKVKAISSYRTSPTPVSLSKSSSLRIHTRTSSACSTTFSINMSCQSEQSTISSPIESDHKMHILPIIPQEEMEQDDEFQNRFIGIPSAPPPPPTRVAPSINKSLETLVIEKNTDHIDLESDCESEIDDSQLEKFRFSTNIESLVTKQVEQQYKEKFQIPDFQMSERCRNSVIQLLKGEAVEEEGINMMLSGLKMPEILEEPESEDEFDLDNISYIDTTLTLDLDDIGLSDIEV